jgi:hypothetical protein
MFTFALFADLGGFCPRIFTDLRGFIQFKKIRVNP